MAKETKRRDVLRSAGVAASMAALGSGVASATESEGIKKDDMDDDEEQSFVGAVMSSAYYKSVRDRLKEDGYRFTPGKGIAKRLRNTETEETVDRLRIPGEQKGQGGPREAEILAFRQNENGLNVVGMVTEPNSDCTPWVKHHVSNEVAQEQTEDGYYTIAQSEADA